MGSSGAYTMGMYCSRIGVNPSLSRAGVHRARIPEENKTKAEVGNFHVPFRFLSLLMKKFDSLTTLPSFFPLRPCYPPSPLPPYPSLSIPLIKKPPPSFQPLCVSLSLSTGARTYLRHHSRTYPRTLLNPGPKLILRK